MTFDAKGYRTTLKRAICDHFSGPDKGKHWCSFAGKTLRTGALMLLPMLGFYTLMLVLMVYANGASEVLEGLSGFFDDATPAEAVTQFNAYVALIGSSSLLFGLIAGALIELRRIAQPLLKAEGYFR